MAIGPNREERTISVVKIKWSINLVKALATWYLDSILIRFRVGVVLISIYLPHAKTFAALKTKNREHLTFHRMTLYQYYCDIISNDLRRA